MSSVLKALKKLEGAGAQRNSIEVARSILPGEVDEPRGRRLFIPVAVIFLLFFLGAVLYLISTVDEPSDVRALSTKPSSPQTQAPSLLLSPAAVGRSAAPLPLAQSPNPESPDPVVKVAKKAPAVLAVPLLLEDILYQEQASDRMAVINGLPVMEGMEMEGGQIREILPDRVLFFYRDVLYTVFPDGGD